MARKSRRIETQEPVAKAVEQPMVDRKSTKQYATAAYGRLSVDNPKDPTDETIRTQMEMLFQYIEEAPELVLVDSYTDNGYSGTNFERPEFIRLMDDVRAGKIQCIVVKDLSRFGRDYLETGYYLETLLPHLNVRLIAITDDFDSFREEDKNSLIVPIKNIVNSMYAKDTSKKLCTALRIRKESVDVVPPGNPPFGYMISEDRTKYVAHPTIAPYVRMIFQWKRMGLSAIEIKRRMEILEVVTPGQYLKMKGNIKNITAKKWGVEMVHNILKNPNYTGDMAMGRMQQALYKSQPVRWTSPEEWSVTKNAHEPLVTREDYKEIRRIVGNSAVRANRYKSFNIEQQNKIQDHFAGLVFCAECGFNKHFNRYLHDYNTKEKVTGFYECPPRKGETPCGGYRVYEDFMKIVVMDQIQILISSMCDKNKLLKSISSYGDNRRILLSVQKKAEALNKKILDMKEKGVNLYENYAEGIIEAEDFLRLKEEYFYEENEMRKELTEIQSKKRKMEKLVSKYIDYTDNIEKYLGKREFDEDLVHSLVEKIVVSSNGNIEIIFKCNDMYQEIVHFIEGCEFE